ncbi:hypothetical protein [uncultured Microbulbifer sp.]|uniref:hypothetical protein n=1 Tax=uncultured Microbulbifer sp. TaxID=348147 RepID=UPI0026077BFB|nr:hypothetical protein [uncultured Microbulbifer sp.]
MKFSMILALPFVVIIRDWPKMAGRRATLAMAEYRNNWLSAEQRFIEEMGDINPII